MQKELNNINEILKITASKPIDKNCDIIRVVVRSIKLKDEKLFQAELFKGTQVFHKNIAENELSNWAKLELQGKYKQIILVIVIEFYNNKCRRFFTESVSCRCAFLLLFY